MKYKIAVHIIKNTIQSIFLLSLMLLILTIVGFLIAGKDGLIIALFVGAFMLIISPKVSPMIILRMYKARKLSQKDAGEIHKILNQLTEGAKLNFVPELYYVPSRMMNAFSIGNRSKAVIALTDGLLRNLNWREITGVLAHEVSHIKSNDLWIMNLADSISRLTRFFSLVGQLIFIFYLPFIIFLKTDVSFITILLLIFSPTLSIMLQLALSRTREFEADINAVKITADPDGLASALQKIERKSLRIWDIIFLPGRNVPAPSMLRTHPHTEKRIQRLIDISKDKTRMSYPEKKLQILPDNYHTITRKPSWKIFGLWH